MARGRLRLDWPRVALRPNHATCFSARLRTKPGRKCRAEPDNTETKQRHDDDKLCHGGTSFERLAGFRKIGTPSGGLATTAWGRGRRPEMGELQRACLSDQRSTRLPEILPRFEINVTAWPAAEFSCQRELFDTDMGKHSAQGQQCRALSKPPSPPSARACMRAKKDPGEVSPTLQGSFLSWEGQRRRALEGTHYATQARDHGVGERMPRLLPC